MTKNNNDIKSFVEKLKRTFSNIEYDINTTKKIISVDAHKQQVNCILREGVTEIIDKLCIEAGIYNTSASETDSITLLRDNILNTLPLNTDDMVNIEEHKFPAVIDRVIICGAGIAFEWTEYDNTGDEVTVHNNGTFRLEDIGKTVFLCDPEPRDDQASDENFAVVVGYAYVVTPKETLSVYNDSDLKDVLGYVQGTKVIKKFKTYEEALELFKEMCLTASSVCTGKEFNESGHLCYKYRIQTLEITEIAENSDEVSSDEKSKYTAFFSDVKAD